MFEDIKKRALKIFFEIQNRPTCVTKKEKTFYV